MKTPTLYLIQTEFNLWTWVDTVSFMEEKNAGLFVLKKCQLLFSCFFGVSLSLHKSNLPCQCFSVIACLPVISLTKGGDKKDFSRLKHLLFMTVFFPQNIKEQNLQLLFPITFFKTKLNLVCKILDKTTVKPSSGRPKVDRGCLIEVGGWF